MLHQMSHLSSKQQNLELNFSGRKRKSVFQNSSQKLKSARAETGTHQVTDCE